MCTDSDLRADMGLLHPGIGLFVGTLSAVDEKTAVSSSINLCKSGTMAY